MLYKKQIDDIIGIWIPSDKSKLTYTDFITDLNSYHSLQWDVSSRKKDLVFLDITVSLSHGHILTDLYHKELICTNIFPHILFIHLEFYLV